MSHLPRVPIRFIESNKELLKSRSAGQRLGGTDHVKGEVAASQGFVQPTYRTPPDRVNGNILFRRNPDGTLDYEYAMHKVVDAIRKVKDGIAPTSLEQAALSCCFPGTFRYIDPGVVDSVRRVNLKITPEESVILAMKVAKHLQDMMDFQHSCHAR